MKNVNYSCRLWITTRFFLLGLSALFLAWSPFAQGAQSVTLAWDRSTDSTVTGYKLYYSDISTSSTSSVNAGNSISNTVSGLVEGKTYSFYAAAYNSSGAESVPSNLINYTVPSTNTPLMVIEAPVMSTTNVVVGVPVTITVRLRNDGTGPLAVVGGSLVVLVPGATSADGPYIYALALPAQSLAAGTAATFNASWTTTNALAGTWNCYLAVQAPTDTWTAGPFRPFAVGVVPPPNSPPTISNIADLSTSQNTATAPIAFTVGDAQTAAGSLVVSGASSNPTLVPAANIVFGGSGANRTVTVTPALNQTGTATITVTVSDGSLTASDSFVLTVPS